MFLFLDIPTRLFPFILLPDELTFIHRFDIVQNAKHQNPCFFYTPIMHYVPQCYV